MQINQKSWGKKSKSTRLILERCKAIRIGQQSYFGKLALKNEFIPTLKNELFRIIYLGI